MILAAEEGIPMLKKILGWVRGEKQVDGLRVEIEVVRPEPHREKTKKTEKSPVKQPDPICPHCGYEFEKLPSRKRKCPECTEEVLVRSKNKLKMLMTPVEAGAFDAEKKEKARKKKLAEYLYMAHLEFKSLDDVKECLKKKTGTRWTYEDMVWKVLNEAVIKGLAAQNYRVLQHVNFAMAHFERDHGRDCFESVKEMHRMRLMEYLSEGYGRDGYNWKVKVSASCECPHCSEIKERTFGMEEALEKTPFPSRECEVWTTGSFPFLGRYQLQTDRD
jgi:predicted Zn-ribbon and HTH transcriptional regulator